MKTIAIDDLAPVTGGTLTSTTKFPPGLGEVFLPPVEPRFLAPSPTVPQRPGGAAAAALDLARR